MISYITFGARDVDRARLWRWLRPGQCARPGRRQAVGVLKELAGRPAAQHIGGRQAAGRSLVAGPPACGTRSDALVATGLDHLAACGLQRLQGEADGEVIDLAPRRRHVEAIARVADLAALDVLVGGVLGDLAISWQGAPLMFGSRRENELTTSGLAQTWTTPVWPPESSTTSIRHRAGGAKGLGASACFCSQPARASRPTTIRAFRDM